LIVPLQPLETEPQLSPVGQDVAGVQPHTPCVPPPPHVWPAGQLPQLIVPPQPLEMLPQVTPAGHVVIGVQPQ
jgi:hypothetical protein